MKKLLKSSIVVSLMFTAIQSKGQMIPLDWEGLWSGTVDIWSYNQKTDSFPMSLELTAKDSVWDFVISYKRDSAKPDIRRYELIVIDSSKHHVAIDEKNSIMLDSYVNDNCLYTRFGGMGSELQTRICMSDGELDYEITSSFSDPIRVSGNDIIESDTMPEIWTYDIYHIMKARLKKEE